MKNTKNAGEVEKDNWNSYGGEAKRNSFKRAFFDGAVVGLSFKFNEAEWKIRDGRDQESKQTLAMIVTRQSSVDEYLKNQADKQLEQQKLLEDQKMALMSPIDLKKYLKEKEKVKSKINLGRMKDFSAQEAKLLGFEAGKGIQINKALENENSAGRLN